MLSSIPYIKHLESNNFFLLAGPCVVESEKNVFEIAEKVKKITERLKIPYVFKASYRKANRSRFDSFTGIGDEKALKILEDYIIWCKKKNYKFTTFNKYLKIYKS